MRIRIAAALLFALFLLSTPALAAGERAEETILAQVELTLKASGDEDSHYTESSLADAVADAVWYQTGAELVLLPGGAFAGDLSAGELSWGTLLQAIPAGESLVMTTISESALWALLEQALSAITLDEAGQLDTALSASDTFPQVSGFTLRYDASAAPGERLLWLKLSDGTELSREGTQEYLLVTTVSMLALLETEVEYSSLERSLAELLADYLDYTRRLGSPEGDRLAVIGISGGSIFGALDASQWVFVAIVILLFLLAGGFHGAPVRARAEELSDWSELHRFRGRK